MNKIKILCDTDTLLNNIRGPAAEDDRRALEHLLDMHARGHLVLFRSEVNVTEVNEYHAYTDKDKARREELEADILALEPVSKEEGLMGGQCVPDPRTFAFVSNPPSDLGPVALKDCAAQGIDYRDTLHILRAAENACDVLLTRDGGILGCCAWLEHRFSGLKIRKPSELIAELTSDSK
jgi:hypothetical protein